MWIAGFMLTVILTLPVDLLAMMFIPQSVNASLSGVTIVCTQVLAPWLLNEPITRMDWVASWVVVVESTGPVFIVIYIILINWVYPKIEDQEKQMQWKAVTYSVVAGLFGGQSNIFFKAAGECVE